MNIIVATSMLEEGLDVQSCNLVIRFDPSATVCSFIQSRGRARMQNSDFILMVRRWVCFVFISILEKDALLIIKSLTVFINGNI